MSIMWPKVRLGELLAPVSRSEAVDPIMEYRLLGIRLDGNGPFHRETVLGSQSSATKLYRVAEGDFIYSRLFACRGAFGVIGKELDGCYVSGEFPTFVSNTGKVDVQFLRLWFRLPSVIARVDDDCTGSTPLTRNRFKEHFFLALVIPLPPVAEQRRIVSRIETLAAQIAEARTLRQSTATDVQVLSAKMMNSAFEPFFDQMVLIGNTFRVTTGGTPSRGNPDYWNGDVNWVSSGEVAFRRIRETAEKITQLGVENSNAKVYPPSTVLIAMIGQGKTRGQCAILDCHAATNQNVAGIHVYQTEHSPEYVYWWLHANYQKNRSVETGTAQPALSGERVKQMLIPLPPLPEQRRIVAYLDGLQAQMDSLKGLQAETAAELDALLPSVLDHAFKGEL